MVERNEVYGPSSDLQCALRFSLTMNFRQELTCPVCHQLYLNPVAIHCGHTLCKGCVPQHDDGCCPICQDPLNDDERQGLITVNHDIGQMVTRLLQEATQIPAVLTVHLDHVREVAAIKKMTTEARRVLIAESAHLRCELDAMKYQFAEDGRTLRQQLQHLENQAKSSADLFVARQAFAYHHADMARRLRLAAMCLKQPVDEHIAMPQQETHVTGSIPLRDIQGLVLCPESYARPITLICGFLQFSEARGLFIVIALTSSPCVTYLFKMGFFPHSTTTTTTVFVTAWTSWIARRPPLLASSHHLPSSFEELHYRLGLPQITVVVVIVITLSGA
uniref:RING-type domain-containing protein n=1 Tax=Steinernema glaseri TaxID=37863 RepID=A0A1I7ZTP3_9BILA